MPLAVPLPYFKGLFPFLSHPIIFSSAPLLLSWMFLPPVPACYQGPPRLCFRAFCLFAHIPSPFPSVVAPDAAIHQHSQPESRSQITTVTLLGFYSGTLPDMASEEVCTGSAARRGRGAEQGTFAARPDGARPAPLRHGSRCPADTRPAPFSRSPSLLSQKGLARRSSALM